MPSCSLTSGRKVTVDDHRRDCGVVGIAVWSEPARDEPFNLVEEPDGGRIVAVKSLRRPQTRLQPPTDVLSKRSSARLVSSAEAPPYQWDSRMKAHEQATKPCRNHSGKLSVAGHVVVRLDSGDFLLEMPAPAI